MIGGRSAFHLRKADTLLWLFLARNPLSTLGLAVLRFTKLSLLYLRPAMCHTRQVRNIYIQCGHGETLVGSPTMSLTFSILIVLPLISLMNGFAARVVTANLAHTTRPTAPIVKRPVGRNSVRLCLIMTIVDFSSLPHMSIVFISRQLDLYALTTLNLPQFLFAATSRQTLLLRSAWLDVQPSHFWNWQPSVPRAIYLFAILSTSAGM
ncbi:hypothetical protein D9756_008858 [Leucocoprinus leucothites]|uniref:Uncharacterized protein n=1 Tax=Leucocoprinus leucothites TaxID=201217 RepID=A0A8H5CY12_9AGAR|nr:hypothetical protein D9756_008858 [Leucoagaricus leucothites]